MAYRQGGTNGAFGNRRNNNFGGGNRGGQGGYHNNNGGHGGGRYHDDENKYVGAPYNFVPFTDQVQAVKEEELTLHNEVRDDLLSGEITYTIKAETPISVDNGKEKFFRDAYNRPAIPGSSIRGLIRSNAQILGFSSMSDDIDDYALMFRHVGANADLKEIDDSYRHILGAKQISIPGAGNRNVSVLLNVQAGYIRNIGGKYEIIPCVLKGIDKEHGKMNYFYLSERTVIDSYLNDGKNYSFEGLLSQSENHLAHCAIKPPRPNEDGKYSPFEHVGSGRNASWVDPYKESGERNERNGRPKDYIRGGYRPDFFPVSYEHNGRKVTAVGKPGIYKLNGYALLSGPMQQKKAIYIIPDIDLGNDVEKLPISKEDINAYKIDLENKKNIVKKNLGFFALPQNGQTRPVFYIYNQGDKRLYFGYTPNIRLFYTHTIKDGLPASQKQTKLDMAKAMFGFINGKGTIDSYKSRVSFSEALAKNAAEDRPVEAILGEPKPTSFNDYLTTRDGHATTYNTDGFKLRGTKQYWLHDEVKVPDSSGNKNDKVKSSFTPLKAGTTFTGKIRFDNLTKEELGLLLWCIRLEEGSRMNIGKGKAYGCGVISVSSVGLNLVNRKEAYSLDSFSAGNVYTDSSEQIDSLISDYKNYMAGRIGVDDIMRNETVRTFFAMKAFDKCPDPAKILYMDINNREYQNRKPLQTVDELMNNH